MEYNKYKEFKKKIIIIDSGIDISQKSLCKNIIDGISIEIDQEGEVVFGKNYSDNHGHGTYCSKMVIALNEEVGIYIIKILNSKMKCSSKALIKALEYTKSIDINVICLSLATISEEYAEELRNICCDLKSNGKILIASLSNINNYSYPAIFKDVIGVKGILNYDLNYFKYNNLSQIQCISNSMPILLKGINGRYKFFRGNSKANALFCGILLNIIDNINSLTLDQIESELILNKSILKSEISNINSLYNHSSDAHINQLEINNTLNEIYMDTFGVVDFSCMNINEKTNIFTSKKCTRILDYIDKTLDLDINKEMIPQYIFYSINYLTEYLNKCLKNSRRS